MTITVHEPSVITRADEIEECYLEAIHTKLGTIEREISDRTNDEADAAKARLFAAIFGLRGLCFEALEAARLVSASRRAELLSSIVGALRRLSGDVVAHVFYLRKLERNQRA